MGGKYMEHREVKKRFLISGHVYDRNTGRAISRLRVEVWDRDQVNDEILGIAISDAEGFFTISFDDSAFSEGGHDLEPDVYFKVYQSDELVLTTEKDILWNVAEDLKVELEVGLPSKPLHKPLPQETKVGETQEIYPRTRDESQRTISVGTDESLIESDLTDIRRRISGARARRAKAEKDMHLTRTKSAKLERKRKSRFARFVEENT